jgi:5-methylcytosine-specific restriction protein A
MPNAPLRRCRCGAVVTGPCRGCAAKRRPQSPHGWRNDVTRLRGHKLQVARAALFRRQPLCVMCLAEGRTTAATIRDHIIPLAEGGAECESNTQGLCQAHSDTKTRCEAKRGRQRDLRPCDLYGTPLRNHSSRSARLNPLSEV